MLKVVGASWKKIRVSTWIIGIVVVLGIIVIIFGELEQSDEDGRWAATVYWSKESGFEIAFWGQGKKIENIPKGVARAYYQSHINMTGWAILDIETQSSYPDWVQAFGAGMLEGSLSWQIIHWQRLNTIERFCDSHENLCDKVKKYLEENLNWIKQMYDKLSNPYWHQVRLFYLQLEGVQKGFEQGVKRSRAHDVKDMTLSDFLWLNAIDDIKDLKHKFVDDDNFKTKLSLKSDPVLFEKLGFSKTIRNFSSIDHNMMNSSKKSNEEKEEIPKCGLEKLSLSSAFVKLVPDEGKLYVAHNSAGPYSSMLKMLKHYEFSYRVSNKDRQPVPGKKITFSSYPGTIHSMDDFYVAQNDFKKHELVIAGTSLPVLENDLWQNLWPVGQVLSGPRIMAAIRLASNGNEWQDIFSKFNSGTGNKQWVIVDFAKFEKIARLKEISDQQYKEALNKTTGLILLAEQIPGFFAAEDKTEILKSTTYWASYGLPYFKNISKLSGVDFMAEVYGDVYTYNKTPVARIFQRDHINATDIKSIAELMRSNFYKTDPYSYKNPRCAVGSRGDLANEVQQAEPFGVTDTKVFASRSLKPKLAMVPNQRERNILNSIKNSTYTGSMFQIKAGPPYSDTWNVSDRTISEQEVADKDYDRRNIEPFKWSESNFDHEPHNGHPDVWNFEPITIF